MKHVRGGSGLGDAIYQRPFVEHWLKTGEEVEVCCNYPDVFRGTSAKVSEFRRERVNKVIHYVCGKARTDTNQWQDLCISAGVEVPLQFDWTIRNTALVERIKEHAAGRKLVVVHGGRAPMGRVDGFGHELLPTHAAFRAALEELSECFLIRVGNGKTVYDLASNIDLSNETRVSDVIDIFKAADAVVAQCSFAVPLSEAFDKPLLAVWGAGVKNAAHPYVQAITPKKVLSKKTSKFVMDDWSVDQIREAAGAFRPV